LITKENHIFSIIEDSVDASENLNQANDEKQNLLAQLDEFGEIGYLPFIIASKVIREAEVTEFMKNLKQNEKNANVTDQYWMGMEKDMDFLGIFFYSPAMNEKIYEFYNYCDYWNLKKWIVSKNDKSKSVALAYQSGFFNRDKELIDLDEDQESNLFAKFKGIFLRLKEEKTRYASMSTTFEDKPNEKEAVPTPTQNWAHQGFRMKDLAFSGRVLEVIMKNEFLARHFITLCIAFENVMGYELSNTHLSQIPFLCSKYHIDNKFLIVFQDPWVSHELSNYDCRLLCKRKETGVAQKDRCPDSFLADIKIAKNLKKICMFFENHGKKFILMQKRLIQELIYVPLVYLCPYFLSTLLIHFSFVGKTQFEAVSTFSIIFLSIIATIYALYSKDFNFNQKMYCQTNRTKTLSKPLIKQVYLTVFFIGGFQAFVIVFCS